MLYIFALYPNWYLHWQLATRGYAPNNWQLCRCHQPTANFPTSKTNPFPHPTISPAISQRVTNGSSLDATRHPKNQTHPATPSRLQTTFTKRSQFRLPIFHPASSNLPTANYQPPSFSPTKQTQSPGWRLKNPVSPLPTALPPRLNTANRKPPTANSPTTFTSTHFGVNLPQSPPKALAAQDFHRRLFMQVASTLAMLFSVLMPARIWFAPNQPLNFTVASRGNFTLVLTDFAGKAIEAKVPADVTGAKEVDVRTFYPTQLSTPGTYILFAVPKGKELPAFVGTPVVIEVRSDKRPGVPDEPIVIKMEPLRYMVMTTDMGDITMVFYYDIAPNTVSAIQTLGEQGFYDGLNFHRIVPGFVIQGGDPHGDGVGGPGANIDAEFSDRKHEEGNLSMARSGDPLEQQGLKPRCEFANSAGSQFFICLAATPFLDGKYTNFGKVVDGMDAVRAIAGVPLADAKNGKPQKAPQIKKVYVRNVTAAENPYEKPLMHFHPKQGDEKIAQSKDEEEIAKIRGEDKRTAILKNIEEARKIRACLPKVLEKDVVYVVEESDTGEFRLQKTVHCELGGGVILGEVSVPAGAVYVSLPNQIHGTVYNFRE